MTDEPNWSEETVYDRSAVDATGAVAGPRTSLVIYWGDDVTVVPLEEGAAVVVGRSAPADIVVGAAKLSREHARFTREDEGVRVCDLGSTNGTFLKDERIDECLLMAGESVRLGPVTITVNRALGELGLIGGVEPYERFFQRVGEELERTRELRRGVALMRIEASDEAGIEPHVGALRGMLRPIDRVAIVGERAILVLMPEVERERARLLAAAFIEAATSLRIGLAVSASSAEALIDGARALVRRATSAQPLVLDDTHVSDDGDEPVLVSPRMVELAELLDRVARSRMPVLLRGEPGVGKETLARALHRWSQRREGPLKIVRCDAADGEVTEERIFGGDERSGLFEAADGGTLILAAVDHLSERAQARLLRALESRAAVGAEDGACDVRVVATVTGDLGAKARAGDFSMPLLSRLGSLAVEIPPLRERPEDLRPLTERFLREAAASAGVGTPTLDDEAAALLADHHFDGNVRELRHVIERAVAVSASAVIGAEALPDAVRGIEPPSSSERGFAARMHAFERSLLEEALGETDGDAAAAAQLLELSEREFADKSEAHGLA